MNAPDPISRRSDLDPRLIAGTAPLPISCYFDHGWFEREMLLLFGNGPGYVGHQLMVPEVGDYKTLPWTEHGKVLVHGPYGIQLLSNTCRNRLGMLVEECPFNSKNFLEIDLELYHVEAAHPGLQKWVDSGNYEWGFGAHWSYQILGIKDGLRSQASPNYTRYRDVLLAYSGGTLPKYGTVWSILYPNVMLEWYPHCLVISRLIPRSSDHTTNIVEFYYPEEIKAFEPQIVAAHQAAYAESAAEDAHVCVQLHRGRKALWLAGEDDSGPFHSPHEDGVIHLHDWIRRQMRLRRTA